MKNLFVVLEGLDGSGTSTQARLLQSAWENDGMQVMATSEPSPGPIGNMIRQAFKGRLNFTSHDARFDRQMAYLFAADRFDHLYNDIDGVIKKIDAGYAVVSTRYYFSSYAYHCSSEEDWKVVERLNREFPRPDLLVYLRNPVHESLSRLGKRATLDSYETDEKLKKVAENYEKILSEYSGTSLILDATNSPENIHMAIYKKTCELRYE